MKLLQLYNSVWEEGRLPSAWKEAVGIPIRKPGKDPSKPTSYRPIALMSNICKIMEIMITERSVSLRREECWQVIRVVLEKEGILWTQC